MAHNKPRFSKQPALKEGFVRWVDGSIINLASFSLAALRLRKSNLQSIIAVSQKLLEVVIAYEKVALESEEIVTTPSTEE
jgi:hypothetical protein